MKGLTLMFRSHFPFWSPGLLSLCLLLLLSASPAWSTEWVEHDVAGLGSGTSYLYAWGGDGIGVTQPTAQAILFFNARTGVWTWHDLDAAMSVVSVRAEGFMAAVCGDRPRRGLQHPDRYGGRTGLQRHPSFHLG